MWCYGIEMWGCASKSNIVIMQRPQSQSHSKCTLVCNKSYSTYRLQHPLRDVIHERINKHHNKLEAHPKPLLQPINTRRLKSCWLFVIVIHGTVVYCVYV